MTENLIAKLGREGVEKELLDTLEGLKEKEEEVKLLRENYLQAKKASARAEAIFKKKGMPIGRYIVKVKRQCEQIKKDLEKPVPTPIKEI
ncbi:MAG TPA: hypothetical protein VMZ91_11290 [Candidatus Paceibacterota bacterium]|nr:hypothetical protein [Candidatus Paceibacterota bacterium]